MVLKLVAFSVFFSWQSFGSIEGSVSVGPGKGVTAFDKDGSFQIHEKAQKFLNVKAKTIDPNDLIKGWTSIEKSSLVRSSDLQGVYRLRNGWFKFIPVQIMDQDKSKELRVKASEFQAGDLILVEGVSFVRSAELDGLSGMSHGGEDESE